MTPPPAWRRLAPLVAAALLALVPWGGAQAPFLPEPASAPPAAAPTPPPRTAAASAPEPPPEHGCLAGVPGAAAVGGLPGRLTEATSLFTSRDREVELDKETTLSIIALAAALSEDVDIRDILNYKEERVDVCVFDRLTSLDGQSVLASLALGAPTRHASLRSLVTDARVVIRFESTVEQAVSLDPDVAFSAIALHGSGATVRLEDVLDIHQKVSVKRTFESTTDLDKDDALLALALAPRHTESRPTPHPTS